MGWKDWSYWLKGGISLGIIGLITSPLKIGLLPMGILLWGLNVPYPGSETNELVILIILSTIFYFIIGAIIGWIYGKVKERR